jgi:hypothetical protein
MRESLALHRSHGGDAVCVGLGLALCGGGVGGSLRSSCTLRIFMLTLSASFLDQSASLGGFLCGGRFGASQGGSALSGLESGGGVRLCVCLGLALGGHALGGQSRCRFETLNLGYACALGAQLLSSSGCLCNRSVSLRFHFDAQVEIVLFRTSRPTLGFKHDLLLGLGLGDGSGRSSGGPGRCLRFGRRRR